MTTPIISQRRGRRIAMSPEEIDVFLGEERTCRLATSSSTHGPRLTALWFIWHESSIWLNSIVASQRWTDIQRDPRVAILVDAGVGYQELRGVEMIGSIEVVGEVPRQGEVVPALSEPERLFGLKYRNNPEPIYDGKHAWLRMKPTSVVSWDFRKSGLPAKLE